MIEIQYHPKDNCIDDKNLVIIEFELINKSESDVYVLKRGTPFDGLLNNCFIVKYNDELDIKYTGALLKSSNYILESDVLHISGRSNLKKEIIIQNNYHINKIGKYSLVFEISNLVISYDLESLLNESCIYGSNKIQIDIINPTFFFEVIQVYNNKLQYQQYIFNNSKYVFREVTTHQNILIEELENEIVSKLDNLQINFDALFKLWFGNINNNLQKISSNYKDIKNKIQSKTIEYRIFEDDNTNNDYAVSVLEFDKIYLYPKFFDRTPKYGFDSQFGTLIHEFSHHACQTEDIERNISCSKKLALNYPNRAICAANNYEYYSEDLFW
jgi:hypothetical protein